MKSLATALLIFAICVGVAETVALIDRADATIVATDLTRREGAARVVTSPEVPAASSPETLRLAEFAKSVQEKFSLAPPSDPVVFADVHPGDGSYIYAQAIYPFLHRRLLCPECSPTLNFSPESPVTRAQSAMVLVSILVARGKLSVLTPAETSEMLACVPDADSLPDIAQPYIATAIKSGILNLEPGDLIQPLQPLRRADVTAALDAVQGRLIARPAETMRASLHAAIRNAAH